MPNRELTEYIKKNKLSIYREKPIKDCERILSSIEILNEEIVSKWAQVAAQYYGSWLQDTNKTTEYDLICTEQENSSLLFSPSTVVTAARGGKIIVNGIFLPKEMRSSMTEFIAVSLWFLILQCDNRLEAIHTFLKTYQSKNALSIAEVSIMYRLLQNIFSLSTEKPKQLKVTYFNIEMYEKKYHAAHRWLEGIHPDFLFAFLRFASGVSVFDDRQAFSDYLSKTTFHSLIAGIKTEEVYKLELNVGVDILSTDKAFATAEAFHETIDKIVNKSEKKYGIGGYMEVRPFYNTPAYVHPSWIGVRWRSMHMGVDIWCEVGKEVFAPVNCEVYSAHDNAIPSDYGPTIILKVEDSNWTYFLLMGHMSRDSLRPLEKGKKFKRGDKVGEIGNSAENGGWPPHLHFQLIRSMYGKRGNFNGLCDPKFKEFWEQLCPSPHAFLPSIINTGEPAKSSDEYIRADGNKLYDRDAQRFLDFQNAGLQYGYNRKSISVDNLNRKNDIFRDYLKKVVGEKLKLHEVEDLKWNLSQVDHVLCINKEDFPGFLVESLEKAGILVSKTEEGVTISLPQCTVMKDVQYFCSCLCKILKMSGKLEE